ncbi:tRNA nucleotidyltransferase [Mitosporidium daphniae]|uniref:tRNA nucleotidyltransferase n=1 Tax=Mitosporidium daphniae TaxID=1485682 RepID=A0A098VLV4_9MICR|nr:tRNA nucleotidyltransferase [Mitosporidium daphniae]KGG50058.1 tRNA nucleotidyltransferase [Mitosporidium daphniae]|eukprot:XP_013236485.1 tRNA nucleotidyltransferase [Mitosporidium daphniae]
MLSKNPSFSILADVIGKAVNTTEHQYKAYMLREDQGPSAEEIEVLSKRIILTDLERRIVSLLNECKAALDNKVLQIPPSPTTSFEHHHFTKGTTLDHLQPIISPNSVILRFAGGWVRDKLLGITSSDIDVSIDSMTGEKFATIFCSFVKQKGLPITSVAVVAARPHQSKHLETACLSLFGQKIDFVNLRSEMYSETSRIPTRMVFGSPSDDAHRRDITINSLFYNIHTERVEDWTGRGLRDLSVGLIRTPLPSSAIFMDDPLRILRVVRFASRFSFEIDKEIYDSLLNTPKIRDLLYEKISRERIGIEVKKMLTGPHPFLSLSMLWRLKIWQSVFWHPIMISNLGQYSQFEGSLEKYEAHSMAQGWIFSQILDRLLKNQIFIESLCCRHEDVPYDGKEIGMKRISFPLQDQMLYLLHLCAIFLPHKGLLAYKSSTDKFSTIPVSSFLCKYALKTTNIEEDHITLSIEGANFFPELLDCVGWQDVMSIDFERLCSCLRLIGPRWEMTWVISQVLCIEKMLFSPKTTPKPSVEDLFLDKENAVLNIPNCVVDTVALAFSQLHRLILKYNLDKLWTLKPILNGTQIIKMFRFPNGNAHVQRLLCELVVWQIQHNIVEGCPANVELATLHLKHIYENNADELFTSHCYPIKKF